MCDNEHQVKPSENGYTVDAVDSFALQNIGGHKRLALQSKLTLHFTNVSYYLKQARDKKLQIIKEACGKFKSGRLTAILGPSGAGKTSMLNVLAGFKARGVTGQFEVNGEPRNLLAFRKMSSYIPQDFVMLDLLTVEETLKVSADLKLPTHTPAADKQNIIDDILEILNMQKCRHTLVQKISGGERKRLSMGIELVTNPPIMFFDEPTSGLDSVASLQVIDYLHRLASNGRIIVCVVHQPSSRLMKLFDDVLVISRGEILYSGPQSDMIGYFAQSGFVCPDYYNPADYVLEVGSEEYTPEIAELVQRNKVAQQKCWEQCSADGVDEKTELLTPNRNHACLAIAAEDQAKSTYEEHRDIDIRPKERVPFWCQFSVLMRRHLISMSRYGIAVQMRLVMHVFVSLLFGVVYWQIGNDAAKVLSNSSCIMFIILFLFFGNVMPSILLCQQDPAVFVREYLNGWYSMNAYYFSKIIADLPMQIICPTAFISISYYMTDQPPEWNRFCMCWIMCLLTAATAHFIGMSMGSLFDLQMAIFLVPASTIPFLLFSGFFIRLNELVWFLRPICDFSFFRYSLEGFVRAIYGYDRSDLECHADFCYYKSPQKFLKDIHMQGNNFSEDFMALCIFVFLLTIFFYISFLIRIRRAL